MSVLLISCLILLLASAKGSHASDQLLIIKDSVDIDVGKRQKVFLVTGLSAYTTIATGLYFAWYKTYDQRSFHFFDDYGEWQHMDKLGHGYSAYIQTDIVHDLARWSGYSEKQALHLGVATSLLSQMTIEVMDGFSDRWGFSLSDVGYNLIGTSTYYLQQRIWSEQRIKMKMSYWPESYDRGTILSVSGVGQSSLEERSTELFGSNVFQRFIKDYNGQTIWASVDISAFSKNGIWPEWLNLAIGYSAENLYGGFGNSWESGQETYVLAANNYPRYGQWVMAIDYNLSRIMVNQPVLKKALEVLDIFKWPAPALSYDRHDGVQFHLIFKN